MEGEIAEYRKAGLDEVYNKPLLPKHWNLISQRYLGTATAGGSGRTSSSASGSGNGSPLTNSPQQHFGGKTTRKQLSQSQSQSQKQKQRSSSRCKSTLGGMVADLLSTSGSSGESLGAAEAVSTERRAETQRNTRLRIAVAEEVGLVPLPQRTLPTNLAEAGWVQHVSRSTGMPYWYNTLTGESVWRPTQRHIVSSIQAAKSPVVPETPSVRGAQTPATLQASARGSESRREPRLIALLDSEGGANRGSFSSGGGGSSAEAVQQQLRAAKENAEAARHDAHAQLHPRPPLATTPNSLSANSLSWRSTDSAASWGGGSDADGEGSLGPASASDASDVSDGEGEGSPSPREGSGGRMTQPKSPSAAALATAVTMVTTAAAQTAGVVIVGEESLGNMMSLMTLVKLGVSHTRCNTLSEVVQRCTEGGERFGLLVLTLGAENACDADALAELRSIEDSIAVVVLAVDDSPWDAPEETLLRAKATLAPHRFEEVYMAPLTPEIVTDSVERFLTGGKVKE